MANVIQTKFGFGQETTLGTGVAATRFIPCSVTVDPNIENYSPTYYRGTYEAPYEAAQGGKLVHWDLNMDCRANDLPMFLESLINPSSPSVATFDTTGRRRTYTTASSAARKGISMEQYDSDVNWLLVGMVPTSATFSGDETGPVKVNFKGFAFDYSNNGSPTTYVNEIYTPLMSWQRLLSIDAAGTAAGTTAVNTRQVAFNYSIGNGAQPVYAGNNTQLPSNVSYGSFAPAMSFTFLHNADRYQNANFAAGTVQVFQVELRGPIVTAAYQGVKFNISGKILTWKPTMFKGLNAVAVTLQPLVDATLGYSSQIITASLETAV